MRAVQEAKRLTDKQHEIVELVAQGLRNKEIAERLFISEQTVKNHLHTIFEKLGVSARLELALLTVEQKLHGPEGQSVFESGGQRNPHERTHGAVA